MPRYVKNRPIILYSNLVDRPDRTKDDVRGLPDESVLQEVKVVVIRPSGDRYITLTPSLQDIDGFGQWYTATLNLNFTDEEGEWKIKWVYRTSSGDITDEYPIQIVNVNMTPMWCFQPNPVLNDVLPDDVKEMLAKDV